MHRVKFRQSRWPGRRSRSDMQASSNLGSAQGSKPEARVRYELQKQLEANEIIAWKGQVDVPLVVNGMKVTTYRVDFVVDHLDGTTEYIEVKAGFLTGLWNIKFKLFEAIFSHMPGVKLTIEQRR